MLLCPRRQSNQSAAGGSRNRTGGRAARSSMPSPPGPPFTRAGNFGWYISSGGQNLSGVYAAFRATGPCCFKICCSDRSIQRRLVPAYLFGAVGVGQAHPATTDQLPWLCHGRRCHFSPPFHQILHRKGPVSPGQGGPDGHVFGPPDAIAQPTVGYSRKRGSGGNDCERPLREGAHRKRPPVTLWFLSGDPERNPPRRAERSKP